MRTVQRLLSLFVLITLSWECVQSYVSPYKSPATGYLVVEGYISGNSLTQYALTRTIALPGDSTIPVVSGAQVQVEGSDNSIYPLGETAVGTGLYGTDTLALNPAAQYRLRISIPNGESYLSAYAPFKPTPAIDSINWTLDANGVNIYANTHDPANATRYYQWSYTQTWEYTSAEQSLFIYQPATNTVVPRTDSQQIYTCWRTANLTNILIGSSAKLAQDEIYRFPLIQIPINTQPLAIEYSMLVRQYALTDSGYDFLSLMQSNTESLGSIFDPTPSQVVGNIHCVNNPDEPVIGYVSAGTVQQQRIFISKFQVYPWEYFTTCLSRDTLVGNGPDAFLAFYPFGFIPVTSDQHGLTIIGYFSNSSKCVDCTAQGGTTQKPSFWPN